MFSIKRRVPRLVRTAVMALLAITALLAGAATAQAAIELSDEFGDPLVDHMVFDGQTIEVHGSEVPEEAEGATNVAVALCDIDGATTPASLGTRCDAVHAINPFLAPIDRYLEDGETQDDEILLTVEEMFDNWDFTTNQPGVGETECADEGDEDCAVVVSFYFVPGPPAPPIPQFLHAEAEEVTFEDAP